MLMTLRIAKLRHERRLSQEALAEKVGIRAATISVIENGKGNPRLSTLQDIAAALGVHVLDLFEPSADQVDQSAILDGLRHASEADKAVILRLLSSRIAERDQQ